MEIHRNFYLNELIKRKNNGLIKIITGIEKCGKSYLLNKLFYDHLIKSGIDSDHIIRFAFDSTDDLKRIDESYEEIIKENRRVNPEKFMKYIDTQIVNDDQYYLLLDEIQNLDCFELVLNGYLYRKNLDVFVTGSFAKSLSKDISTEFAGRGDKIHMYPLSFAEFMSVYEGDKYSGLSEYMQYGGIPSVVICMNPDEKSSILQNLFEKTYTQNIQKQHRIRNINGLKNLIDILSLSIGSLTNPERLKNSIQTEKKSKITSATIKRYIDCLEDSFLIDTAERYDIRGKTCIETPKKYYFTDLGLRNSRINFRQIEKTHSMQNVIYNELKMRGYNVDVGVVQISERDSEGNVKRKQLEIDFVCNLGSLRYYIQSAFSMPDKEKHIQEIRPFRKIDDSFKKIIITGDVVLPHYDEYGILTVNIYDFLLDPNLLEKV